MRDSLLVWQVRGHIVVGRRRNFRNAVGNGCFERSGETRPLQKMKNSGNELKEVLENKVNRYFECSKSRAFCAQISSIYPQKGANKSPFDENEPGREFRGGGSTVTTSRLDCSENCGAGVSPAVAGASRSRARAGCPCHSGQDARAPGYFMGSRGPRAHGTDIKIQMSAPAALGEKMLRIAETN